MSEYVGQGLANFDVRPKRAAYLIPPRRTRPFLDAVERACSRWGGITEPIVTVSPGGRVPAAWRQIVQEAAPDVIFNHGPMSDEARRQVHAEVGTSPIDIRHEDRPRHGVHVLAPFGDRQARKVVQSDGRRSVDLAAAGRVASWDSESAWRTHGLEVSTSQSAIDLAFAQLRRTTVVEATAQSVETLAAWNGFPLPVVLWITRTDSLRDLLWFWNLRALALRGFEYNGFALIDVGLAREPEFQQRLREWLAERQRSTTPDVIINSFSVPSQVLRGIVKSLGLQRTTDFSMHLGEGATGPLTAAIQVELRRYVLVDRLVGYRTSALVAVERPKTTVRMPSPIRFADLGGHLKLRLSGLEFLNVPRRSATAQLFHHSAEWWHKELELETNANPVYQFEFNVPVGAEVLAAAVSSSGAQFTVSQPGRLAEGVLRLAMDDAIFEDPDCHRLVSALTTPRSRALVSQLVAQLPHGAQADIVEAVARSLGSLRQVDMSLPALASKAGLRLDVAAGLIDRLVRAELALRGLRTECDRCGLKLFVALQQTAPDASCSGCGAAARYAAGRTAEPELHYRLNALLDRASDQGVLCHLYAAAHLRLRKASQRHVVLGADVSWSDGSAGEVDVLGYLDQRLFAGEAKMTMGSYTPAQVARDIKLSHSLGADVHVMACLQAVPSALAKQAEDLASDRGMEFWLLAPG